MENVVGVFIPIVALTIPIFGFYFGYKKEALRRQERIKAIEKGMELPPEPDPWSYKKELLEYLKDNKIRWLGYLQSCLIFLALGIGFAITALIFNLNVSQLKVVGIIFILIFSGIGATLGLVGLGLLIYSLILRRYEKD